MIEDRSRLLANLFNMNFTMLNADLVINLIMIYLKCNMYIEFPFLCGQLSLFVTWHCRLFQVKVKMLVTIGFFDVLKIF